MMVNRWFNAACCTHLYRVVVVAVALGSIRLATSSFNEPGEWRLGVAAAYADDSAPTLRVQFPIAGGAQGIALNGSTAFVCAAGAIDIIDVHDPTNLFVGKSFGSGGFGCTLSGSELLTFGSGETFPLNIYSVADLNNPQLLGSTSINYFYPHQVLVNGNYGFIPVFEFDYDGAMNVTGQHGDLLSISISPPSAPNLIDVLFNTSGPPKGGNNHVWLGALANSTTALFGSTTSTGGDVVDGTGRLLVVDISNPAAMSVAGTLDIPGTLQLTGIVIQGSTALAVGSSGSWASGALDQGLTGHIVLTTLDVTDPRHPSIIAQQNMARAARGLGTSPISVAEGVFAFANLGPIGGQPEVIVVNAPDPHNITTSEVQVPADVNGLASGNGELYTTSSAGLLIYDTGATPSTCVGDCDGSGDVTVNKIIILVNIALGSAQPSACPHGIPSGSDVNVALIIQAVNHALTGCGG